MMTTIGFLYDEWTKERFRRHYKMAKVIRNKPYRNDYRKVMAKNMQKNIDKIFPRGKAVWRLLKTSKTIW
ncbi:hypothetical protein [Enterobacter cloacae]|uniref:hypothetical protein n=1 Tax=Enterobacter cloacae TaxID=550 RepID=UPI003D1AD1E4